jgi:hypothetical protein
VLSGRHKHVAGPEGTYTGDRHSDVTLLEDWAVVPDEIFFFVVVDTAEETI